MASTPNFGSTPRCGSCQLTDADGTTPKDFDNFAPASAGTRVRGIRVHSGPTTSPGGAYHIAILVHDGTNARVIDVATLNDNADARQAIFRYDHDDLRLPSGYKLQAVVRDTLAAGSTLDFVAEGEDLT